jgi:DNA-directed RNA polymerase subunit RPC12/RpoP
MNTPKICIACGAAFKRSPADVTVRCPDCRAGRTADVRPCVVCNDEHVITEAARQRRDAHDDLLALQPRGDRMTWTKRKAGFYTLDGTEYAVASMNATNDADEFVSRVEWAVVRFTNPEHGSQDGENVDWFDTMRDAKAVAERMAGRNAS